MITDSYFAIGSSHKVCEDYAIHSIPDDRNLFAISDGCSSCKDTDFGSRILLKRLQYHSAKGFDLMFVWEDAKKVVRKLDMPLDCLYATMLYGYTTEKNGIKGVEVVCVGDGYVVAQDNKGNFEIIKIEYNLDSPYYLIYEYERSLKVGFTNYEQKKQVTISSFNQSCELESEFISNKDDDVQSDKISKFWFPLDTYTSVSVFSDGLDTFLNKEFNSRDIALKYLVKQLITIGVPTGNFIKGGYEKLIHNNFESAFYDDFSMATIIKD